MRHLKYLLALINVFRLFPHCILLCFFFQQCKDDIDKALKLRNYPCHNRGGKTLDFIYLMTYDKYYRNLFYKRIGHLRYLISWMVPPQDTFTISTYMPLGKGMLCVHPHSTNLNAKSIGDNFIVKNNVTLGEKNGGIPTIGNSVLINVNSVIVGDVKIGNNVIIGACTLIMKDVPDNCVVAGNPAYIIRMEGNICKIKL